jgi:hypothetical protein
VDDPDYTAEADYRTLVAAVRADPADEVTR